MSPNQNTRSQEHAPGCPYSGVPHVYVKKGIGGGRVEIKLPSEVTSRAGLIQRLVDRVLHGHGEAFRKLGDE